MTFDPTQPNLDDLPPEWDELPAEVLARLLTVGPVLTTEETAELNRIAQARWFLVRNDSRARCGNCRQGMLPGAIHDYLTLKCVEAPFNGLRQLQLYTQHVDGADLVWTHFSAGTIVPITATKARQLNERIIERGGRTMQQQIPIRPDEIDPDAMRRRLLFRTRGLRAVKGV